MKFLALIGAVTILASVATEVFTQSTVQYESCQWFIVDAPASIPKAHTFDPVIDTLRSGTKTTDMDTKLAIYKGLINPPQNSSASMAGHINCLTGNCTFVQDNDRGSFATLGICHSCRDITDQCKMDVEPGKTGTLFYSLESGAVTKVFQSVRSMVQLLHMVAVDTPLPTYIDDYPMFTVETIVISPRNCTEAEKSSPQCQVGRGTLWEPAASSCSLYPCVKNYNAKVVNGTYTESQVLTRNLKNTLAPANNSVPNYWLTTDETFRNGAWTACGETSERTDVNTQEVFASNKTSCLMSDYGSCQDAETLWYPPDCVWTFPRRQIAPVVADNLKEKIGNHTLLDYKRNVAYEGEPYMQRLYRSGGTHMENVLEFMGGISDALTERIRTKGPDSPELQTVPGRTFRTDTCISVRFEWLAYLGSLLFLEIVFLVFVIYVGKREGFSMDWKSSSLAAFFYPIDRDSPEEELLRKESLEKTAKEISVCLSERDGAWKFHKME